MGNGGLMVRSRSSTPKSASASALFRRIGLDCSVSAGAGTANEGSSAANASAGRGRGDSILCTTALSNALAFATWSFAEGRDDVTACCGDACGCGWGVELALFSPLTE